MEEHRSRRRNRWAWYRRLTLLEMLLSVWLWVGLFSVVGPVYDPDQVERRDVAWLAGIGGIFLILSLLLLPHWLAQLVLSLSLLHLAALVLHLIQRGWPEK